MTKSSARSNMFSSRFPERYHITTLSPRAMRQPPTVTSRIAVLRMWATGVCQRMSSGARLPDQVQPGTQLRQLRRISIEGDDACADRAARRVVPPYYEQHD